jgi:hypothetical protein
MYPQQPIPGMPRRRPRNLTPAESLAFELVRNFDWVARHEMLEYLMRPAVASRMLSFMCFHSGDTPLADTALLKVPAARPLRATAAMPLHRRRAAFGFLDASRSRINRAVEVAASLPPDLLLMGEKTGQPAPPVIALPDRPRQRQSGLGEFFRNVRPRQ